MNKFETWWKNETGKYIFLGWYDLLNEEFCIETKETKKFIYKTYKWLSGDIEFYRYTK